MTDTTRLTFDCSASSHPRFSPSTIRLKEINFFYGANGSGKSTFGKLLEREYGDQYDVRRFEGFNGLVGVNESMNAISLGQENTEAQKNIDDIDSKIQQLMDRISGPDNDVSLVKSLSTAEAVLSTYERQRQKFLVNSAREIKNETNPQIAVTSYNAPQFSEEIPFGKLLSDVEVKQAAEECRSESMVDPPNVIYPKSDVVSSIACINKLLTTSISASAVLAGIGKDPRKRAFAREGMEIHDRHIDKNCAFCGGKLTEERWKDLDTLFNEAAEDFRGKLQNEIKKLEGLKQNFGEFVQPIAATYYVPYRLSIEEVNKQYLERKDSVISFIERALLRLRGRLGDLFSVAEVLEENFSNTDLSDLQIEFDKIHRLNQQYGRELEDKKANAQRRLRLHKVARLTQEGRYGSITQDVETAEQKVDGIRGSIKDIQGKIDELKSDREDEVRKTSNQELAANRINNALQSLGNASFELRLIKQESDQKGQYQIFSENEVREISTLSTGEKNIVAFLYFMQKLGESSRGTLPMLVIMDDPMNSNDDATQYLMYSSILRFYGGGGKKKSSKSDDDIFVLLTHNPHFFLNCRPYSWNPNNKRVACFALQKNGRDTNIRSIDSKDIDICTGYQALWQEFEFAYKQGKPGIMWNPLRRIISTFSEFSGAPSLGNLAIDVGPEEVDSVIAGGIKKVLDVYSHELYDMAFNPNSFTSEQILHFAEWYFKRIGYQKHFDYYWGKENSSKNGSSPAV